jgi:Protein of unknown function (DUF2793)
MTDPILFDSASPRFGLPLLFAGQAQKEAFVNEAHLLVDSLLHCSVEGEASAPPVAPAEGEGWIVGAAPTGSWAGQAAKLAFRQAGNWLFADPRDGMAVLDRSSGQLRRFLDGWQIADEPVSPSGGSVIDVQAREAITGLIAAMRISGILPAS